MKPTPEQVDAAKNLEDLVDDNVRKSLNGETIENIVDVIASFLAARDAEVRAKVFGELTREISGIEFSPEDARIGVYETRAFIARWLNEKENLEKGKINGGK